MGDTQSGPSTIVAIAPVYCFQRSGIAYAMFYIPKAGDVLEGYRVRSHGAGIQSEIKCVCDETTLFDSPNKGIDKEERANLPIFLLLNPAMMMVRFHLAESLEHIQKNATLVLRYKQLSAAERDSMRSHTHHPPGLALPEYNAHILMGIVSRADAPVLS